MVNASEYSIEVRKGNFEGEVCFQARVKEIPYLEEYADSFEEAYSLVIDSIEQTSILMAEKGRPMPAPMPIDNDYSGRVTLRLPKTLHRYLASYAEYEDVSLNSLIASVLSNFRGFDVSQDLHRRTWSAVGAFPHGAPTGQVERRVARQTRLRVVGGSSYVSDVA